MSFKRFNSSQGQDSSADNSALEAGTLVINSAGQLRLHDGATVGGNPVGAATATLVNGSYTLALGTDGVLTVPASQYSTGQIFTPAGVNLFVGTLDSGNYWQFKTGGVLQFPDTTQQTTAFSNAAIAAYTGSLINSSSIQTINSEINGIYANLGAFETYANLTFGTSSYGDANVASYLTANPPANITVANISLTSSTYYPIVIANTTGGTTNLGGTVAGLRYATSGGGTLRGANVGIFPASVSTTSIVASAPSVTVFNALATTVSIGGQAANIIIGNASGVASNVIFGGTGITGGQAIGNVWAGNIFTNNYFYANGVPFVSSNYGNTQVAAYLVASAQTIGNLTVSGTTTIGTSLQLVGSTNTITTTNGSAVQFGQRANFNSANGIYVTGNIVAQSGASSNSTNTGAVQVSGGVGVSGSIYAGGNVTAPNFIGNTVGTTANYTGNVYAGNVVTASTTINNGIVTTANVQANYFIGNGSALTGISANSYGNIYGTTSNVTLQAGNYNYTFDTTGNLTIPAGGDIVLPGAASTINMTGNIYAGNVALTGSLTMPNRPAFRVYGSGNTNNLSTTVNSNGILNSNNWAIDYQQGTSLNGTTGVFTAPIAGLYQVNFVARVVNNTSASAQAIVYKNYGSGNIAQAMWETGANCTVNHFGVSTVSKLAVGDTLSVKVTVGSINFDGNDNWSVAFIG